MAVSFREAWRRLPPRQETARPRTPVERRVARIATPDLNGWAEQCLTALGRELRDYQRSGEGAALDEAEMGAQALLAVIQELRRRTT